MTRTLIQYHEGPAIIRSHGRGGAAILCPSGHLAYTIETWAGSAQEAAAGRGELTIRCEGTLPPKRAMDGTFEKAWPVTHYHAGRWNTPLPGADCDDCREPVPTCDVCGRRQGDSPWSTDADQPADWNGETGNHRTCESLSELEKRALAGDR
jgi:hypothetical protein